MCYWTYVNKGWVTVSQAVYRAVNISPEMAESGTVVESLSRVRLFVSSWISWGFLVHHHLPELISVESVMRSNHLILYCLLLLLPSIFPSIRAFPVSQFFTSSGQSIGVSASALVLPMNIQDWFPLEWTGWISF